MLLLTCSAALRGTSPRVTVMWIRFNTMTDGEFFGEIALVENLRRVCDVQARVATGYFHPPRTLSAQTHIKRLVSGHRSNTSGASSSRAPKRES